MPQPIKCSHRFFVVFLIYIFFFVLRVILFIFRIFFSWLLLWFFFNLSNSER